MKLTVSVATFNEIAGLLEVNGVKSNERGTLTLEKSTLLIPPIDYRLVTIRRDCVIEATKIYHNNQGEDFIELCDRIYRFVLNYESFFETELLGPKKDYRPEYVK